MDRSKSILSLSALALYAHFALQLVAGGLLHVVYRSDVSQAHATTAALHLGAWRYLQAFHYWGSSVLIVHSALHLVGVTWAGWWRGPQVRGYLAAVALAALAFGFQLTGNVLPADRHGVQTAAVEGSIAARVPGVGPSLQRLALGGDEFSPKTLTLWHAAHSFLLPVALLAVLALGWRAARGPRGAAFASVGVALLLALLVAAPFGSAATPADYGAFDAKPSWYTVPMHGLLVRGGWIGAMVVPLAFGLVLLALPRWKPKIGVARSLLLAFGGLGLVATLVSGGEAASLVGTRDPASASTPTVPINAEKQDAKLAAAGRALFAAQGCNNCHGKDGLQGVGGPSLASTWKAHPEAEHYERYVHDPQSVKKGSTMPAYPDLKADELRAIAEFLRFAR